jgi:hypothetical protein
MCQAQEVDFRRLDVSRLKGIQGPFNLILDIGCFHSLSSRARARYVPRLAQLIHPGGTYLLYTRLADPEEPEDIPPSESDIMQAFSPFFLMINKELGTDRERTSAWYWMHSKTT